MQKMTKKRRGGGGGGGRTQSQGQGVGKRKATTPVGGVYKDMRQNNNGEENFEVEDNWALVISNKPKSPARQINNVDHSNISCKLDLKCSRSNNE